MMTSRWLADIPQSSQLYEYLIPRLLWLIAIRLMFVENEPSSIYNQP